jgi:hypothetical protein
MPPARRWGRKPNSQRSKHCRHRAISIDQLEERLVLSGMLGIAKTADVPSADHGAPVNYGYAVTFTPDAGGPTAALGTSIAVTDAGCGPVNPVLSGMFNVGDSDSNGNLDADETWQYACAFTTPALHSEGEEDPIQNTANVIGDDVAGESAAPGTSNTVSVDLTHAPGTLSIVKAAAVSSVPHGGTVLYTFDVTYTPAADGAPAQDVAVTDAQCSTPIVLGSGDTDGDLELDVGETWHFSCDFVAANLHSDGEEDPLQNTATASGEDLDGEPLADATSNTVTVDVVHTAGTLSITKSAASTVSHDETITYTFDVTYMPGTDESPAQNIVVTDDECDAMPMRTGGDANSNNLLDGDETWTYSCTQAIPALHTAGEEDPIQNTASVTGQDLDGDALEATSNTVSVNIVHAAGTLNVNKMADATSVPHGGTVTYTLDVSYTPGADGSPAQIISVTDAGCDAPPAFAGGDTNANNLLDGGETWQYTCAHAVPALHATGEEDPLENIATVTGQDIDGDALSAMSNTVVVDILHDAGSLTVVKIADVSSVRHGQRINYSFAVTYTPGPDGSPAQNVAVSDPQCDTPPMFVGEGGGDTDGDGLLDVGETWSFVCTFDVPAMHSDGEEDSITNTATATAEDLDGDPVTPDTSNTLLIDILHDAGTLNITKSADATTVPHGGTVNYTLNVRYTPGADGSPARNIVVTDAQCVAPPVFSGGDSDDDLRLDAGETWTYSCSFTVPLAHSADEEDPILNAAMVTGEDLDGDAVTDDTSNTVLVNIVHDAGSLSVTKSASATTIRHGETLTYTFEVTYAPGSDGSPAQNITIIDPQCDTLAVRTSGDTNANGLLDGGEMWILTCNFTVLDHLAGEDDPISNTATVTGQDLDGDAVASGISNTVLVDLAHDLGTLSVVKEAESLTVAHGGTVNYTLDVTYAPGPDGTPAQNVMLVDSRCDAAPTFTGGDADADGLLDGGETWTYICSFAVPATHSAGEEDPIRNAAAAIAQDLDGDPVATESNTVSVDVLHDAGSLSITKSADRTSVEHSQTVTYSFEVRYTPGADGSPARNVMVTDAQCDAMPGLVSGDDGDGLLDASETWTFSCSFTVPAGHAAGEEDPIENTATVTATDLDGDAVTPDTSNTLSIDLAHPFGFLAIAKSADAASVAHGGTVTYTFHVTFAPGDTGLPAQNVAVSDPQCDAMPEFIGGDSNDNDLLEAGETWQYRCTFAVPTLHSSGEEDPITNVATVTGQDTAGNAAIPGTSNAVSVNVVHAPGTLSVVKSADPTTVTHGGTVTYGFAVTYTPSSDGSPAQNIVVSDSHCDAAPAFIDGDTDADNLLDAGETWNYRCTFTVPAHSDSEEDPIVNLATANGQDLDGDALSLATSNSVSVDLEHLPGTLAIVKSANMTSVPHGGALTYSFAVTYTPGADGLPAQNVAVDHDACDDPPSRVSGDTNDDNLLDSGETWTFTCLSSIPDTHSDTERDPIRTAATAIGEDLDGDPLADAMSNTVSVDIVHFTIRGRKYLDLNGDGAPNAGEPGLPGWTIFLDTDNSGSLDDGEISVMTDATGAYSFTNLVPGTYTVREVVQAGWRRTGTNPGPITATGGGETSGVDFGNQPLTPVLIADPADATRTALLVLGTAGNDRIDFRPAQPAGSVAARMNRQALGTFLPTGRIIVFGNAGNDTLSVARSIGLPAEMHGGAGNDKLHGGAGPNILVGDAGDDQLRGGSRRDLLIGGTGADRLNGGPDDDILVAGPTNHDAVDTALRAILSEWTSARPYATRVANLRTGTGAPERLNGSIFLNLNEVDDDAVADRLTGSAGLDWFFAHVQGATQDQRDNQRSQEIVDVI